MLIMRYLILAVGVCALWGVPALRADDPTKPEVSASQVVSKVETPENPVVDAVVKLMESIEREALVKDATPEVKDAGQRCRNARAPLQAGDLEGVRKSLFTGPTIHLASFQVLSEVFSSLQPVLFPGNRPFNPLELRQDTAQFVEVRCLESLTQTNLNEYGAWSSFLGYLNDPKYPADEVARGEIVPILQAELHGRGGERSKPADIANISESFNSQLKNGKLVGLGKLVAQAIQQAPSSAKAERMKLRLVLRLCLRKSDFMSRSGHVNTLSKVFTSAARRRMALGEIDAARSLATDALPLNIPLTANADSPSKVLADIQSMISGDARSPIESPQYETVVTSSEGAPAANLLVNSSIEEGQDKPDHWQQSPPLEGVTWKWDRETGFQSKSSLSLEKTAQRYFPIAQWFQPYELNPNTQNIHLSAQVKAEKLAKAVIDVSFRDQADQPLSHQWVAYIGEQDDGPPITHDWKLYEGDVAVPTGAKTCYVSLQIYGPGKVWFDDVLLDLADRAPEVATTVDPLPQAPVRKKSDQPVKGPIQLQVFVSKERAQEILARIRADLLTSNERDVTVESKLLDGKNTIALSGPEHRVFHILGFIEALDHPIKPADAAMQVNDPIDDELNRKTELLAEQIRNVQGADREKLKRELEQLVAQHFNQRQARRTKEIDDLAHRVEQMRGVQQKREANRGAILKRRVADLLIEETGLEWNEARSSGTPSATVPPSVDIEASVAREQTSIDRKADKPLEPNGEPTFNGVTYSEWLKTLELERNPEKVVESLRALKEMTREEDATRIARSVFRFVSGLSRDAELRDRLLAANMVLSRLPADPVMAVTLGEIRKKSQNEAHRQMIQLLITDTSFQPEAFSKGVRRHAKDLLTALIETKEYPRNDIFEIAVRILPGTKTRLGDVPGLDLIFSNVMKEAEAIAGEDEQRKLYLLEEVAKADPEYPEVVQRITQIPNRLRSAWDALLKTPESESLVEESMQVAAGSRKKRPVRNWKKLELCLRLIDLLVASASSHKESLPLLKEISATEWPKTKPFESIPETVLIDFKQKVAEAVKTMESTVVSEQGQ